jgi:hypothetical protein
MSVQVSVSINPAVIKIMFIPEALATGWAKILRIKKGDEMKIKSNGKI